MNGAGWAPQVGSLARLLLFEDRIEITPRDQRSRPLSIPLRSLDDLRIDGRLLSNGEEFLDGRSGVREADEGALGVTVLDTLTVRSQNWATIDLIARNGWVRLRLDGADAVRVRDDLRILADAIVVPRPHEVTSSAETARTEMSVASLLEKLARLRDGGVLSDEEFRLVTEKLLRST
jgi:hypothetical protein